MYILVAFLLLVSSLPSLVLSSSSSSPNHDYCLALHNSLLFYEAQRSGRLTSTNRIPWRGNSFLQDATNPNASRDALGDGNLAGGYSDDGFGVKFGFPLAFTTTVLSWGLIEYGKGVEACGETAAYKETIKWATDWMIKAHTSPNEFYGQVGNSELDQAYWGAPENMPTSIPRPSYKIDALHPGTDLAMELAAALAAASLVFNSSDAVYSATLLRHARDLYRFGDTYRGFYHDSIPDAANFYRSYGYDDEIVWASGWMYRATRENIFLERAKQDYLTLPSLVGLSFDWDQKTLGAAAVLGKLTGDAKYGVELQRWFESWQQGEQAGVITYTPGGLAWARAWGPLRYASSSSFISLLLSSADGNQWAANQLNYILGTNPSSTSFLIGYSDKYPRNPQHRGAHGSTTNNINFPVNNSHILVGALVSGPGSNDEFVDSRESINNEVTLDFNAAFTAAISGMAQLTGDSIPPTPSPSPTRRPPTTPSPTRPPTLPPTRPPTVPPTLPPTPTPIPTPAPTLGFSTHSDSSPYWFACAISSSASVSLVEIMGKTSQTFMPMEETNWGYWVFSPHSELILPLTFRFTLPSKTAMFSLPSIEPGSYVDTNITY